MTQKELFAYNYLKQNKHRFVSQTEVGNEYANFKNCIDGKHRYYHSSTGSPMCLKMVKFGFAERNEKGHYKFVR